MRGSGAYEGKYAAAVAGYRVGPDYIEAHRAYVAVGADEHGGRVLGFYSLVLAPPELDLLFVADEAQGRGIGRLLVAHMQSEARAAGLDRVMVSAVLASRAATGRSALSGDREAIAQELTVDLEAVGKRWTYAAWDAVQRGRAPGRSHRGLLYGKRGPPFE